MFRRLLLLLMVMTFTHSAQACDSGENCIEENAWQFGVAVGIGGRSNPLVDGDNVPLVLLPDIAWYGEHAYFDNGELGYQWQLSRQTSAELFIAPNFEKAFFTFWHPSNLLIPVSQSLSSPDSGVDAGGGETNDDRFISVDDVASRDWSADIGTRLTWREDKQSVSLVLTNDALSVHNGHQATLSFQRHWQIEDWRLRASASLAYKSANLIDYYYGIDGDDTNDPTTWYQAGSSWQPSLGLQFSVPLNDDWTWLGRFQYTFLDSAMTDSPLVSQDHYITAFIGLGYRF